MTDDEIKRIYLQQTGFDLDSSDEDLLGFARAIEQASSRAALEDAANHITRGIDGVKQNGWIDAANERLRCADAIRALAKETNNG
jgi:hypothetical protein